MKARTVRPRTAARVAAVQALFQCEQGPLSADAVIEEFARHRLGGEGFEDGRSPDADGRLFGVIVRAAVLGQDEIDRRLSEALPVEWPLGRLDSVLRALLRAGAAELSMPDGAPVGVLINEYLDVAHGFFSGDEPKMVNGILGRLARELRPAIMGSGA